ncbi:MAG: DUF4097 domain-containing protein [Oscillospiraceae bacterium]|nr:DUF4097 domain-containing protein [Oscillospiraceae bacterium]
MSRARLVTLICWIISALALLGLAVWVLFGGIFGIGFDFGVGTFDPVGTHSVSADNIDAIDIDWTSGAVYIGTHHGNDIRITEFARRSLRDNEELWLDTNGGTLAVRFAEHHGVRRGNMLTKQLEILIPYTLSQNLDSFSVNTVSGRIAADDIHAADFLAGTTSGRIELGGIIAQDLRVTTTSGRIELRNITAQTVNASTTSGRIEVFRAEADEISLRTVSGRITTTDTEAQSLRTHTTSGRHELFGTFGYVNARSTSGRIEILSRIVPERVVAHATSGRIELTVPVTDAVHVQYSTGSGRFRSDIPVVTHGGADAQFNLSTTSGRISIFALAG